MKLGVHVYTCIHVISTYISSSGASPKFVDLKLINPIPCSCNALTDSKKGGGGGFSPLPLFFFKKLKKFKKTKKKKKKKKKFKKRNKIKKKKKSGGGGGRGWAHHRLTIWLILRHF